MLRVTRDLYKNAVLDVIEERAGIGTVLRACAPHCPRLAEVDRHVANLQMDTVSTARPLTALYA